MTVVEEAQADKAAQDSALKEFNDLGERATVASRSAKLARMQFWWEFGVWALLTLLGGALFAERKDRQPNYSAR